MRIFKDFLELNEDKCMRKYNIIAGFTHDRIVYDRTTSVRRWVDYVIDTHLRGTDNKMTPEKYAWLNGVFEEEFKGRSFKDLGILKYLGINFYSAKEEDGCYKHLGFLPKVLIFKEFPEGIKCRWVYFLQNMEDLKDDEVHDYIKDNLKDGV